MISQAGYLPDLLEKLTSTEFEDSFSKRVSEAWVSRILAQVSKKTTGKLQDSIFHERGNDLIRKFFQIINFIQNSNNAH